MVRALDFTLRRKGGAVGEAGEIPREEEDIFIIQKCIKKKIEIVHNLNI